MGKNSKPGKRSYHRGTWEQDYICGMCCMGKHRWCFGNSRNTCDCIYCMRRKLRTKNAQLKHDERDKLRTALQQCVMVLEQTQFGFNHRRCPLCAGAGVGPNGETDNVHTSNCLVSVVLDTARKVLHK